MHKAFQLHDVLKHNLLVLVSIVTLLLSTLSCEQFYKVNNDAVIGRAGNSFLYHSELENNIINFNTESDSIIQAENYINNWARKQLLINQAVINLDIESQEKLDELVSSYRSDLWSSAYKEFVVKSSIDTLISKKEIMHSSLKKDSIILLGSLVETYWIKKGDKVKININGMGSVLVNFV